MFNMELEGGKSKHFNVLISNANFEKADKPSCTQS